MEIQKLQENDRLTLTVNGRLETATAPQLDAEIRAISPEIRNLTIGMADVEYVSSAGLRVILTAQKAMNACGGHMELSGVNPGVKHVFDITGFTSVLNFV